MHKITIMAVLCLAAGAAIAQHQQQQAPPTSLAPAQLPPAGGVIVPQEVLAACAADGGCVLISANALLQREFVAALQGMQQSCTRPQSEPAPPSSPSPGKRI